MDAFDREMEHLDQQLDDGQISQKEYSKELLELQRDYRAEAEDAAQRAYDHELERW